MRRVLLFFVILIIQASYVFAGTKTWNNVSGGNWNLAANWAELAIPVAGDTVYITLDGTYNVTMNANSAALSKFVIGGSTGIQTLLWSASVTLTVNGPMTVNANGVITLTQNSWIVGTDSIYNYGTLRLTNQRIDKEVINLDSIEILGGVNFDDHLINRDTVFIQTGGTLSLNDGSTTQNGVFDVVAGGNLVFNTGTHLTNAVSNIQGTGGYVKWNSATTNSGGVNFQGRTQILSGIITFDGAPGSLVKFGDTLDVSNGTVNFNTGDPIDVTTLNLSGGTLTGTSPMSVFNQFNWSGGTMSATDSTIATVIQSQALFSVNNRALRKRTLVNQGTITWTAGHWENYDGAIIQNNAGALIDAQGDHWFYYNGGTIAQFINNGTLRKSGGTVVTTIQIQSTHTSGAIQVQAGSMTLNSSSSYTNTPLSLTSGKYIQFNGGTHTFDATSNLSLTGSAFFSSGTVTMNGSYSVTDSSHLSGGTITFGGAVPSFGSKMNLYGSTVNFNTNDSIVIPIITQNSGTANFSMADSIIVTTLNLTGGTLTGNSPMRIVNQFNWSGGTMSATDSTIATVIQTQALFSVNNRALRKRTLINQGTIAWSTGHWENYDGAIIQNNPGALIDAQSDYWFYHNGGTVSTFINNGTFRKSAGTGTSTLQIQASHLNGQIQIQSGIITFNQTGTYTNTDFTITNHAILQFNGGTQQLDANSDITGTGAVRVYNGKYFIGGIYNISDSSLFGGNDTTFFTGGTNSLQNVGTKLRVDNGIVNFVNGDSIIIPTYWQLGGTLTGNSPMRITSECRWESGTIMATDSLITLEVPVYATLNMNGGLLYLAKRTFNIYANMNWNSGWFRVHTGAIINNYGTWDHRVNNQIENWGGSLPYFNNYGTYIKSTSATNNYIYIGFRAINSLVQVKKGSLVINNTSQSIHTRFVIDSSANLQWESGTHDFDSLSSITGQGNLSFTAGTSNVKDTVNIGGETFVWGGTANFTGHPGTLISLGKKLTVNGAVYFNSDTLKIDSLTMSGTLGGTAPIYVNSKFVLNGGVVTSTDSAATLTIPVGATFYWSGNGSFQRRTINNYGTAIWTSPWGLDMNAVYNNMPGALTEWTVDGNTNWFGGSSNSFNNYGTLRKSGGTGISSFEYYVNNYGLIEVQSGTLYFGAGGTHSNASFTLSPGSTINFPAGNHTFDASSSVTGTGTVLISPTTFAMDGVYNIIGSTTIGGGTINFDSTFSTTVRTTINGGTTNFRMMPGHLLNVGNRLNVAGGTVNFVTTDSLKVDTLLVNGTLNGNNHWYIRNYMQLTAGAITSPNRTLSMTLPIGSTFNWSGNGTLNQRTVFNYGTANWSSPWGFSDSTIYNNMAGAVTNLTTDYNSNWFFATGEPYLINYGTLNKTGGTGISSFEYQISNYGTIQVDSGLTILCYDSLVNFSGGIITGKGTLDVSTRMVNQGTIRPGMSPGVLSVIGNYSPSSTAVYEAEIGGTQRFSYDSLSVSGTANLNGTLALSTLNGFIPSPNDTFKILNYGSRTGTFSTITGDSIGGGIRLYPEYRAKELVLYASNANPTAANDNVSLNEDDSINIYPLSNDTDADGDSLTIQLVIVAPLHGSYSIMSDTAIRYIPNADFNGADSLTYKVIDRNGGNDSARIYFAINSVNDSPVLTNKLPDTTFTEDFAKKFIRNLAEVYNDVDNSLTFGASNLSPGVVPSISNDSLYVSSSPFFNGLIDIRVEASDGQYTIADTFAVDVSGVNNVPFLSISIPDTTLNEDFGAIYFAAMDSHFADIEGDSLMYTIEHLSGGIVAQVLRDTLWLQSISNFHTGPAIIRITASDGQFSVSDTFDVMVTPVNDPVTLTDAFGDIVLIENFAKTFIANLTTKFSDLDGVTPVFGSSVLDLGVTTLISGDTLYLKSISGFFGQATVRVSASDTMTNVADTFSVNVLFDYRQRDSLALVTLYDSTNGDAWTTNTNWKSSQPIDTWYGVTVSNGRVTQLNLFSNNLSGALPSKIGDLSNLTNLNLGYNQISGLIPIRIFDLISLQQLWIGNNNLQGSIPPEIGNLTNMTSLVMANINLTGVIPSQIGDLTQLQELRFDNNQLSGIIPPELANLTSLVQLGLSNNQLTGGLPSWFGNLTNLEGIELGYNQLGGTIPVELASLTHLRSLNLTGNQLTGTIPSEFSSLLNLLEVNVSDNDLAGPLPSHFSDLTFLRIEFNRFTFEDIEPIIGIGTFTYSPQDSVGSSTTRIFSGSPLNVTVVVGGASNQYQWMRNGVDVPGATDDTLIVTSVSDTGTYICKITNTVATELTLYSRPIQVTAASNVPPSIAGALSDTSFTEDFAKTLVAGLNTVFADDGALTFTAQVLSTGIASSIGEDSLYLVGNLNFNGTVLVKISANDGEFTVSDTFAVSVSPVNDAPLRTNPIADQMLLQDFEKVFGAKLASVFSDVDNMSLNYGVVTLNAGVDGAVSNDTLYLLSTPGFTGASTLRVTASDGEFTLADTFIVNVSSSNLPPQIAASLRDTVLSEDFGQVFVYKLSSYFTDADNLTYAVTVLDAGLTAQISNDSLFLGSVTDFNDFATLRVTASDGVFTIPDTFIVTVSPVNDAPVITSSISDVNVSEDFGTTFVTDLNNVFSDVDHATLTYGANVLGSGVTATISGDSLRIQSINQFNGSVDINVIADDGEFTVADTFTVMVSPSNDAPTLAATLRDTTFSEDFGRMFYALLTDYFADTDLNTLTFTPTVSTGITATVQNDSLYLTSSANFNGNVSVAVHASDGALSVTDSFTVYVAPQNDAPSTFTLIAPAQNAVLNILRPVFRWNAAKDIDGDALQYLLEISTQGDFSTISQSYTTTDTAQTLTTDLDSSSAYFWRVTANDGNGGSFRTPASGFQTDATKPNLRLSILQGTVAKRYLDAYAYSNEALSGTVNSTFTLKNISGTVIDTRSLTMSKIGTSNLYSASYHLSGTGNLEVLVTAQDIAGNQRIATRNYTVTALLKGETFVTAAPEFELILTKPASSESGLIVAGSSPDAEFIVLPSLKAGVELIGTTELRDALRLTIRYDESELKFRQDFDERKIGIYRVTEYGVEYIGGQGRDHAVTASIQSFGKYVVLYDDRRTVVPDKIELSQNYPNPFNPSTTIQYGLTSGGRVKLVIYNILGQQVRELLHANQPAGYHKILWDGRNSAGQTVSTGVYIYRLETPTGVLSRKMMLVK